MDTSRWTYLTCWFELWNCCTTKSFARRDFLFLACYLYWRRYSWLATHSCPGPLPGMAACVHKVDLESHSNLATDFSNSKETIGVRCSSPIVGWWHCLEIRIDQSREGLALAPWRNDSQCMSHLSLQQGNAHPCIPFWAPARRHLNAVNLYIESWLWCPKVPFNHSRISFDPIG